MANTGNTQQQINYGASANDGQGDPLRTAFIKTDDNFDNVWLAGPVGSNITIGNNTIQSNNTNGNIILKPNGTGIVQANASIIPNADGVRDLGSSTQAWRRAYINELLPEELTVSGDAVIGGNLTVQGDTIQIGNITTDTLTIQLANTAANATAANGAGITVGASDNIATILYNSTANRWNVSVGLSSVGNISAPYFSGNGSLLTGIVSSYGNANVANYLPGYGGTLSSNNIIANSLSANNLSVSNNVNITQNLNVKTGTFTGDATGDNSIYAGFPTFTNLGSDVIAQFSGNTDAYIQFNLQNGNPGNQSSGDYVITADNGNDTTHFLNIGLTGGNWDGTQPNSLNSRLGPNDGYMYVQDGNLAIGVKDGNTTDWIWRFDITGSVTADGNLIPSANGVYSLGNSTNYWANLWVANNTIYIGGVPLGITAGNVLTVNGNAVLSNNSSTAITTTGNISAGNVLTGGRVSATGNVTGGNILTGGLISATGNISGNNFIGNGSQLTGITANTGNVTFSGEAVIGTGTSNTQSGLYLAPDPVSLANDLYLRVRGNIQDEPTHIHFDTGNNQYYSQFIGDDNKYIQLANTGNIVINSNDAAGNSAQWTFGTGGTTQFPNSVILAPVSQSITMQSDQYSQLMYINANVTVAPNTAINSNFYVGQNNATLDIVYRDDSSNQQQKSWLWSVDGTLTLPTAGRINFDYLSISSDANVSAFYAPAGNVQLAAGIGDAQIVANSLNDSKTWTFGNTGNLTAPGNVSAVGNITGAYIFGNGSQLTDVTASVPSQTILPTIQTITVEARPAGLFGGGTGGANVTVANTIPVTEYGVIITDGTVSEKYKTGSLGSIPGTVSLTFTTGLNSAQFTVFAYVTSNAGTFYSNSATGTSGICLLAGTQIALSDGSHKSIEDITYHDKLLSWDFDRGCYAETTAVWIKRSETGSQYNLLTFSDGTTLRTFDQHRIFNKQAGAFTYPMTDATPIGTVTVNEHGQEITLINKQVIVDTIEYYNVITDYHMNLFSDTVLTSCRFNNIYPITDMKFVKDGRKLRTRAEFENVEDRFFHGLRLAEQTTDVETIEWYVNRLISTEVSTQLELTF
jgi:predicted acyltransferase (DUF342 family)